MYSCEKPYACKFCAKCFPTLSEMGKHELEHIGEKPPQCMVCNRRFATLINLRKHMKKYHKETILTNDNVDMQIQNGDVETSLEAVKIEIEDTVVNSDELETVKNELLGNVRFDDKNQVSDIPTLSTMEDLLANKNNNTSNINMEATSAQPVSSIVEFNENQNQQKAGCTCPNCLKGIKFKNGEKQHNCHIPGCNKTFGRANYLQDHLRWHKGEKPFECKFCGKCFRIKYNIQKHERTHYGKRQHECKECHRKFMKLINLAKHMKKYHKQILDFDEVEMQNNEEQYQEEVQMEIKDTVIIQEELETVKNNINLNGNNQVPNTHTLSTQQELPSNKDDNNGITNMESSMNNNKLRKIRRVPCTCPNCSNGIKLKDGKKQHNCHIPGCDKTFWRTNNLQDHLRWHSDEKPFVCKFCGKRFRIKYNIRKHELTHTGETPLKCMECNKKFMTSENLAKHMRVYHGQTTADINSSNLSAVSEDSSNCDEEMITIKEEDEFIAAAADPLDV